MTNNIKQTGRYLLITLITIVVYGFILYLVFTWLAGYSLLHAYIGNLAIIVAVLVIDGYGLKMLESEKFVLRMQKEKDPEKIYRNLQLGLNSVGSFKSDLYMFYIFILVFSQVIELNPTLIGENFSRFVHANNYSILFLIAFDMLIRQLTSDRERMKNILERLRESLMENQDQRPEI